MTYLVRRQWLPAGDWGVRVTLSKMRQLVRDSLADPLLVGTAAHILDGVDAADGLAAALALRRWLADAVVFVPDPVDRELLRTPRFMLREVQQTGGARGDCDDVATLGAALGAAVGIVPRFVVVGFSRTGPLEHVWTELETPAGWVELDVTRPPDAPEPVRTDTAAAL